MFESSKHHWPVNIVKRGVDHVQLVYFPKINACMTPGEFDLLEDAITESDF